MIYEKRWERMKNAISTVLVVTSIGLLAGCGANDNNNLTDPDRVNYSDRYDNNGTLNNDRDGYGNFMMNDQNEADGINPRNVNLTPDPNPFDDNDNRNIRQEDDRDSLFNVDGERGLDDQTRDQLGNRNRNQ
jgi:predicted small lipoprotein YifL